MSKKSIVQRNNKRHFLSLKYVDLRSSYRLSLVDSQSMKEKFSYSFKLQKLPRNSLQVRFMSFFYKMY